MVEGAKSVQELLASDFEVVKVIATPEFLAALPVPPRGEVIEVDEKALEGLGEFQTNRSALAIARLKPNGPIGVSGVEYGLVLDDIRDPGKLGTIIRTADWFGLSKIIASRETADVYNPKVISATMGSFTRVNVFYTDLPPYLAESELPVYGAFLNGRDVHEISFAPGGLIVIGSESHGISDALVPLIRERITIPRYGGGESLNAAIATAIICDNVIHRRTG